MASLLVVMLASGGFTTVGAHHAVGAALQQDPQAQTTSEKKQKKKAKKSAADAPAPDEIDDPDSDEAPNVGGPRVGVVWKQHPSIRLGDAFRLGLTVAKCARTRLRARRTSARF